MDQLRRTLRTTDRGFFVVLAITFLALWPFLSHASLPEGTDAELHIFRLAELSYLLRGGEIYPRWAPNFYHGFGYPIFNYYAPLTYYLGALLQLFLRLDAVAAVKAVFVLGLLLAGFGMYGFVRDNWGRRAGYVATAVFLYAPYVHYIDPHARGVLPESFSFGMFAVALWAVDRVRQTGSRWAWITAVLLIGGLIMSHNLMGLLFFTLLFAWAMWQVATTRPGARRAALLFGALVLGLGVAAVFWLPVVLERDAITLGTLVGEGDNYDFRMHFLSLRELLAPSLRLDWGATEPAFRFNLGVAQWLLGGLGVVLLLLRRVRHAAHAAFFALALAVLVFLMLPLSQFVWEAIPVLPFFQFPWRLLGPAAAVLGVLAGVGFEAVLRGWETATAGRRLPPLFDSVRVTALFVLIPLILALPLTQVPPWPNFGEVNVLRMSLIENTGRWLGTTSTADYVPATVDIIPQRKGSVVANFERGLPPDRINWDMIPEGATVETETIRPLFTRYVIDTPRPTRLRLYQFAFPGWQARIDGQPVATELGRPEGFIVVPVPAGQHVVEVEFGSTPARALATVLTLASLLIATVVTWRLPSPPRATDADAPRGPFADAPVLGFVVVLISLTLLFFEPQGRFHYDSPPGTAEPAQTQTQADFGEQITLLGFDTSQQVAEPGDTLRISLYWQAQQALAINYQVFLHVLAADGTLVAQSDHLNPGDFPTRRWPTDKYVRDDHVLTLPADLPAGEYTVATGVWVQSEGWRLPLLNAAQEQIGDSYRLFTLRVE